MSERRDSLIALRESLTKDSNLRYETSKYLQAAPDIMRDFKFQMGSHLWKGIIYMARNSLMGSLISLFDSKPFVLRGYPKINYAPEARILDRDIIAQEKVDGTNLGIWILPDGSLMGKTRLMPRFDTNSLEAEKRGVSTWKDLFLKTGLESNIYKLASEDYCIYGELYGYFNQGDFIKYSIPIAFKVFDILDMKSLSFLPFSKVKDLCSFYNIPVVDTFWEGKLTYSALQNLEYEAESFLKEDGAEGFVVKSFYDEDMHFAKVKCDQIKEKIWKLETIGIPLKICLKAVRKVRENFPYISSLDEYLERTKDELKEEIDPQIIEMSSDKIRNVIRRAIAPTSEELKEKVRDMMLELKEMDSD